MQAFYRTTKVQGEVWRNKQSTCLCFSSRPKKPPNPGRCRRVPTLPDKVRNPSYVPWWKAEVAYCPRKVATFRCCSECRASRNRRDPHSHPLGRGMWLAQASWQWPTTPKRWPDSSFYSMLCQTPCNCTKGYLVCWAMFYSGWFGNDQGWVVWTQGWSINPQVEGGCENCPCFAQRDSWSLSPLCMDV